MDPLRRLAALATKPRRLLLGLMSGMSMDGLDLALVEASGTALGLGVVLRASETWPYDEALRARIRAATTGSAAEACRLSFDLAERWSGDLLAFLARVGVAPRDVDALGSHGQTLYHASRADGGGRACTLQVGDGDVLAERTGILTVSDFRPRDVAAGGEGAPLIPYADWCLWARPGEVSACVNLGSIANVTVVTEDPAQVLAFDTGPANALIDGLARVCPGAHGGIDRDGTLSAAGRVDARMLQELADGRRGFFDRAPPKSAGFSDFGPAYAADLAQRFAAVAALDRVRTAVEHTAATLSDALHRHVRPRFTTLKLVRLSGGGTRNPTLLAAIRQHLEPEGLVVEVLEPAFSDAKEAVGFALLADATLRGIASNLPSATGARHPALLGKISLGAARS